MFVLNEVEPGEKASGVLWPVAKPRRARTKTIGTQQPVLLLNLFCTRCFDFIVRVHLASILLLFGLNSAKAAS